VVRGAAVVTGAVSVLSCVGNEATRSGAQLTTVQVRHTLNQSRRSVSLPAVANRCASASS